MLGVPWGVVRSLWLSFLVACGGAVPRGEPPDTEVPVCVRWSYRDNADRQHVAQACVETTRVCNEVVGLLQKFGRLGNVEVIGECEEW